MPPMKYPSFNERLLVHVNINLNANYSSIQSLPPKPNHNSPYARICYGIHHVIALQHMSSKHKQHKNLQHVAKHPPPSLPL